MIAESSSSAREQPPARVPTPSARIDRSSWLVAVLLVTWTIAVYAPIVRNGFVGIDTGTYLTDNAHVQSGVTTRGFLWALTTFHAANWHPLTWWSHMLDVELFGLRPVAHHAVNVAFHAANGVLVFLALRALTARVAASLVVAALFVAHPLHVESVAWIVERKDVLSTFLGLAALLAWTSFARGGSRGAYVASIALFAASLLAKPMWVTFPFVLLLLDAWPLARGSRGWRANLREKLPFLILSAASCLVTVLAQRAGGAVQSLEQLSFGERIANASASYAWYAVRTVWPAGLSFHYPLGGASDGGWRLLGVLFLLVAVAVGWTQRRERPWIAVGAAIFLGTLVPVIGLVQVGGQARADRYTYVPLLGLFVAVVFTVDAAARSRRARRAAATIGVIAVTAAGVIAYDRVGAWKDSETLARRALDVDERTAVAHDLLGWTLVESGRLAEGLQHLARAVELSPGDPEARRNHGRALVRAGRLSQGEAELRMAASLRPDDLGVLTEIASVSALQGNLDDARATYVHVLQLDPRSVDAHTGLGEVLERAGDLLGARREFTMALALDPRHPRANVDWARLCLDAGDTVEAEASLRRVLSADPDHAQALQQRARLAASRRDFVGAVRDLRASIASRPSWPLALADLAWWLACAPDPAARDAQDALRFASDAVALGNDQNPAYLDVLAAAYAANARFPEAAETATRAVELARKRGDEALAQRIDKRRVAYEVGIMDIGTPR